MASSPPEKSRAYGLFATAAIIYTLGVIAFSAWSYFEHRAILLAHIDKSLIDATHATEQIIGTIFIECAVELETIHEGGYAATRIELDQFAEACQYDLVMAVAVKGTHLWTIVGGVDRNGAVADSETLFQDPIQSKKIVTTLRELDAAGRKDTRVLNLYHDQYGYLRVAVRYIPLRSDTGYALIVVRNNEEIERLMRAQIFRKIINGMFLLIMAFPLVALFHRAKVQTLKKMAVLNERLRHDVAERKKRELELEDAIHDLERFNSVTLGRENRVIELKAEINTLLEQMNRQKRYNMDQPN